MKKLLLVGLLLAGCQTAGQQAAAVPAPVVALTPPAPSPWAEDRVRAALAVAREDMANGQTLQVVKTLDPLITAQPDNLDARALRSVAYFGQGLRVIAQHDADAVLAKDPNNAHALYCRALCKLNGTDPKSSLPDFNKAMKLMPGDLDVHYHRAVALSLAGRPHNALADLNVVLKKNPRYALAYQQRALVYHQLGDKKRAVADVTTMKKLMLPR